MVNAAKNLLTDVTRKVDVKNMQIEGEVLDSETSEQVGAMTASRGSLSTNTARGKEVSWKELNGLFTIIGKRLRCGLEDLVGKESEWNKCGSLGLAAPTGVGRRRSVPAFPDDHAGRNNIQTDANHRVNRAAKFTTERPWFSPACGMTSFGLLADTTSQGTRVHPSIALPPPAPYRCLSVSLRAQRCCVRRRI